MNDNLVEATVWITGLVCGTVLTLKGHGSTFEPLTAGLFLALTARHTRAALRSREEIRKLQREHSGATRLPEEP